ncbi:MAG: hypothetical protein KIT34_09080 [Cyanobacteria bacterium TGS_CYA1]|nr:hypothetical protein [Cyanobacteria bacterium TGS_CYA1]
MAYDFYRSNFGVKFISSQSDDSKTPQDDDEDVFDSSRVNSKKQAKMLKQAVASNPDAFVSFSEGMASVDKFELIYDSMTSACALPLASQEFVSFSQGMANVDKFELIHSAGFIHNIGNITSFAQAAEVLAQLSGLSDLLCKVLTGVKAYPFLNLVSVEWKVSPEHKEFCAAQNLLQLDSALNIEETLLDLCHQLYHLANPCLDRLYSKDQLDFENFKDTMLWSETAALICEAALRRELGFIDSPPVQFLVKDDKGDYYVDLDALLVKNDLNTVPLFLEKSTVRGSVDLSMSDWISSAYESYIRTFKQRSQLIKV